MDCPRCGMGLSRRIREGMEVDHCPACRGDWFDQAEYEALLRSGQGAPRKFEWDILLAEIRKGKTRGLSTPGDPVSCLRCGTRMEKVDFQDQAVYFDRCPEGCGVWMDTGELRKIQVLHLREQQEA